MKKTDETKSGLASKIFREEMEKDAIEEKRYLDNAERILNDYARNVKRQKQLEGGQDGEAIV